MHSDIWDGVRDQLAGHFRLHLVDLPGHGGSASCETATLQCMVEKVAEVLPDDCTICGWSLGGQVSIELALQLPLRVKKLILVSTTPCFINHRDWQWGMDEEMLQLFIKNLKRDYVTTLDRFLSLQVKGSIDTTAVLAKLKASFSHDRELNETSLQAGLQILLTTDLRNKIEEISQPVVLIHGENDIITHPSAARWMHQKLPSSELLMLSNCGHAPFLSHPDQFITKLIQTV
jgi:pimeloyl-[acyl-carrier protein] methyl ester esterase